MFPVHDNDLISQSPDELERRLASLQCAVAIFKSPLLLAEASSVRHVTLFMAISPLLEEEIFRLLHCILPASMSPLLDVFRFTSLAVSSVLASVISEELDVVNVVTSGAKTLTSHSYLPRMETASPLGKS